MTAVRPAAWTVVLVVAVLASCGCGPGDRAREPRPGGTLTMALRDSFATLDPADAWDPLATPFLHLLYDGLVAFDDSGTVRPACAGRWETSADGRTIRFHLRPGLRYASGTRIVAADFKNGLERLFRTGSKRSVGAPQFAAIEGALRRGTRAGSELGIETPDDRTLVLHLAWPDPFLLEKLAQPRYAIPVPSAAAGRLGDSYGAFPQTNGPYRVVRGGAGSFVFLRNPHYAAAKGSSLSGATDRTREHAVLRGLPDTIRVLTGVSSRRAMLGIESGRLDLVWPIPKEWRERLVRSPRLLTVRAALDPPVTWYLALNAELAPTARRDARRAVAFGVNRQVLFEELGPAVRPWRAIDTQAAGTGGSPGYDPTQSRAFLSAARYDAGIRLPVTVPRGSALSAALEALAPGLARGSIQVDDQALARGGWERALVTRRGMVATIVPWQPPSRDGLDGLASLLLNRGLGSGWAGNLAWYHPSAGLDTLLLRGLREHDPVARQSVRDQLAALLESDLPLVPLARVQEEAVHVPEWTDVRFHPRYGLDLRALWRAGRGSSR